MDEIFKVLEEIQRVKVAMRVSKSKHLIHQYSIHLSRLNKKLQDYCREHDIKENQLWREYESYKIKNTKD